MYSDNFNKYTDINRNYIYEHKSIFTLNTLLILRKKKKNHCSLWFSFYNKLPIWMQKCSFILCSFGWWSVFKNKWLDNISKLLWGHTFIILLWNFASVGCLGLCQNFFHSCWFASYNVTTMSYSLDMKINNIQAMALGACWKVSTHETWKSCTSSELR